MGWRVVDRARRTGCAAGDARNAHRRTIAAACSAGPHRSGTAAQQAPYLGMDLHAGVLLAPRHRCGRVRLPSQQEVGRRGRLGRSARLTAGSEARHLIHDFRGRPLALLADIRSAQATGAPPDTALSPHIRMGSRGHPPGDAERVLPDPGTCRPDHHHPVFSLQLARDAARSRGQRKRVVGRPGPRTFNGQGKRTFPLTQARRRPPHVGHSPQTFVVRAPMLAPTRPIIVRQSGRLSFGRSAYDNRPTTNVDSGSVRPSWFR